MSDDPYRSEVEVQAMAAEQATHLVNALRAAGWVFAAVVLWGRARREAIAGASYFDLPKAFTGAMPTLARAVRRVATEIDVAHRSHGGDEWGHGYLRTVGGSAAEAIVAADHDRIVLQVMAEVPEAALERVASLALDAGPSLAAACQAELNRRHAAGQTVGPLQ